MSAIHVFQIGFDHKYRKVSPEAGFSNEGAAWGYAIAQAASSWNNKYFYVMVKDSKILGVTGGLRPAASSVLSGQAAEDDGDEYYLAEAA